MAIDTTATRTMSGLLDTLLQMSSMSNERKFRADEAELSREFAREQNELNAAAENFTFLRQRKTALEDEMRGYTLPYQTKTGGEMISGTLQGYQEGSDAMITKIDQLTESLNIIAEAGDFAKGQADEHGAIIAAGKDEAWKDYLLEGGLEMGEQGLIGTGEMIPWLEKQSPGTIEKLKDENYRRSMMTSLRTIEEAKNLQAIDVQLEQANLTMDATRLAISKNEFEYSVAQLNESDKQVMDIYKNTALSTKANFRYTSDGVAYSISDLFSYAASDVDDFMDIKEGFLNDPANYAIAHEAEAFISGIQQAASMGMDDSEYVIRFQKSAYDNYVQLQTLSATLIEDAARENKTLKQYLAVLPDSDRTKATYKRLNDKHTGYKRLGLFRVGYEMLDRGAQVVNMHNEVQALRLSLDASTAEQIAQEGLGLRELEDYSPTGDLTPKMQQDLEVSLATLAAMTPDPGRKVGGRAVALPGGPISKAELDVFESIPSDISKDYWRGPLDITGEALDRVFTGPDTLRPQYVDPNAPPGLAENIRTSLDQLQDSGDLNLDESYNELAGIFTNSNYLKSTGIPFAEIVAAWKDSGASDLGDWLIEMFPDIEADLIR